MAGDRVELCGFLDAKLPGNLIRKRPFSSWKAWRRHWCTVRKLGPGLGVEVQLERGINIEGMIERRDSIKISSDSIICRTESRTKLYAFGIFPPKERKPLLYLSGISESETQRWMANLRQLLRPRRHRFIEGTFNISMVDNSHSRTAGLTGLYGDLVASRCGVFIKDVHTGNIVQNLEWNEMNQFHLTSIGHPDDVKRICVIHTTKHFRSGIGQLHIFCINAQQLLQNLVTQGREPRHKNEVLRPLSLSEGDLRISDNETSENLSVIKNKVVSTLAHAGLDLLYLSKNECSMRKDIVKSGDQLEKMTDNTLTRYTRAIDNVYETEPANFSNISSSLEELEEPLPKRMSNISLASGIYEEIIDNFSINKSRIPSHLYENLHDFIINANKQIPPPLPPRVRCISESTRNGSISDIELDSEGDSRSVVSSTQEEITPISDEKNSLDLHFQIENSDYVPMSPRLQDIVMETREKPNSCEEQIYMIMR
ncbi:uncharacterized protein [Chelonus insularis]|uniref:uncharacterized protein n=1 Tax=Chelonus insularis TaxID=460826 RepID=UPI00158C1F82|nr:uncharacterized protein LOC118073687 [Chelonus insularis]XP_034950237.1 uncharacterized protein LOC118073687 [Chelonus insularis]